MITTPDNQTGRFPGTKFIRNSLLMAASSLLLIGSVSIVSQISRNCPNANAGSLYNAVYALTTGEIFREVEVSPGTVVLESNGGVSTRDKLEIVAAVGAQMFRDAGEVVCNK